MLASGGVVLANDFDALRYVAGYPDLIAAFGTDEVAARNHYEMFGRAEGRDPFRFDPIAYSAANGDLLRAFGTDARALSLHYLQFGFAEGRTTTFGAYQYAASYGDLRIAMGSDVQALTQHYVRWGFAEGRTLNFDSLRYAASHPDVYRAVGSNPEALARHYLEVGGGGNDTLWLLSETAVSIDLVRGEARSNDGIAVTFQRIENAIGGEANDTIIGNDEANVLRGYNGDDRIYGGGTGTDGRFDILMGGPGNDILVGGAGYDSLRGDAGDDLLVDRANGSLSGHEGNDVLVALLDDPVAAASNLLFVNLGAGADTLVISAAVGTFANIRVSDFNRSEGDRLDLSNLRDLNGQVLDFADVMGAMTSTAEGLQIDLSQFRNVSGASLSGQVVFTSLSQPSDVGVGMFVFENGIDWRSPLPTDWLL